MTEVDEKFLQRLLLPLILLFEINITSKTKFSRRQHGRVVMTSGRRLMALGLENLAGLTTLPKQKHTTMRSTNQIIRIGSRVRAFVRTR